MIVPLEVQARSDCPVAAFFPNPQDQRNDLRRNSIADMVGPSLQIAQAIRAFLFKALLPDVVQRPGNAKEPASLADVPAHALRMLQHAQPGFHLPRLDLLVDWIAHAEPPAVGWENNPPVRHVY